MPPSDLVQRRRHMRAVHNPSLHGVEAFVLHELRGPSDLAEAIKLIVVGCGEDEVSIGSRHHLVGDHIGVVVPNPCLPLLFRQIVHSLICEQGDRNIEHRDVHVLTQASRRFVVNGRQDANDTMETCSEIEERQSRLHGLAIRHTCKAHRSAHGLDEHVVGGTLAVRPCVPEASDAAVHQTREFILELRVAQPILVQGASLEVLDEDIAFLEKMADHILPLRLREVDGDTVLVSVATREVRSNVGVLLIALWEERGRIATRVVTGLGTLHLDHFGPHVGEHLRRRGACEDARQVQDPQA
mmetsp:Transcript_84819/g.181714  ORF Transcript_84819/g.181714 Transcript_84819/m.181714 type:complete len:299 (+) Transcript_84819:748-1644(+)